MSENLETARRYRLHAEDLRSFAEGMETEPSRDAVVEVANDYERMAKSLEAMDRSTTVRLHQPRRVIPFLG
jgi:hypothetical protein